MSEEKVIDLPGITTVPIPPAKILAMAAGQGLTDCVVIGWKAGEELYFASTTSDGPEVLWMLEKAKLELLQIGQE
jgi:hypothetical protein